MLIYKLYEKLNASNVLERILRLYWRIAAGNLRGLVVKAAEEKRRRFCYKRHTLEQCSPYRAI